MSGAIPPLPQYAFMAWCLVKAQGQTYLFYLYNFRIVPLLSDVLSCDFCGQRGVKHLKIHRLMLSQYTENCITRRKAYQWAESFRSDRTSVVDEDRSGRPASSRTTDNDERATGSRGQMDYCHWCSRQVGHLLWICIFHHPRGHWVSQNLCKVSAKAGYRWAQTGSRGKFDATFAAISWRRRIFHVRGCHRRWNMRTPLWTCK
jgi:hypothetical protein